MSRSGPDILQKCVDAALARDLEFILIGGHAVNARGYERATFDIDFLIAGRDLAAWSEVLEESGYRLLTERIGTFAQYRSLERKGFPVDLMLVDEETFTKLREGSEWRDYGGRSMRVVGILHLIALKLHALRSPHRELAGKDFSDILQLITRNGLNVSDTDLQNILQRYGTSEIRDRLFRELGHL